MSNSIVAYLITIALTTFVPIDAWASESSTASYSITPRQLISLARHGRFKAQGIPSHNNFRNAVRTNKITATELIESAIANNRLSESVRGNREYFETVTSHLKSGGCGS